MLKTSSNGKPRKAGGAASRTAAISAWVEKNLQKKLFKGRTSKTIAALCSDAVGFNVPVNKMARELDRAGVSFLRTPADPPQRAFSKTEYLRAHLSVIEERLDRVEKKMFGKSFARKPTAV